MGARTLLWLATLTFGVSLAPRALAAPMRPAKAPAVAQRLAAGRALCEETRWGEAVVAFEDAAAAAPADAQVLSELGWAAFRAGDHAKARVVLDRAVRRARDPGTKAASLYNLGRVEEAAGRRQLAARRYRASLALRENDVVWARLAMVEYEEDPLPAVAAPEHEGRCSEPRALEELCACVAESLGARDAELACTLQDEAPAPGLRVLALRANFTDYLFLVQRRGHGWSSAGEIAELYSSGVFGQYGQFTGVSARRTTVGGRDILRFTIRSWWHDADEGINEVTEDETETETLCLLGAAGELPRCVLSVPVRFTHQRKEIYDPSQFTEEEIADFRRGGTEGLPITWTRVVRVEVGADGVAQVVLVEGREPDEDVPLGPRRLW